MPPGSCLALVASLGAILPAVAQELVFVVSLSTQNCDTVPISGPIDFEPYLSQSARFRDSSLPRRRGASIPRSSAS